MRMAAGQQALAIDSASVVAAGGGVLAAVVAGAFALWLARRNRELEREKIQWQSQASEREKRLERERERQLKAEEAAREAEESALRERAQSSGRATAADAYRSRLGEELSRVHMLDMNRPLDLDRLYVQVRIREQRPLRYRRWGNNEFMERVLDPEKDAALLGEDIEASEPADTQTYAPVEALRRYQHIVVVGDPGAGKTTMLRHLAYRMARREPGETLPELPVHVELSRYIRSGHDSLLDYAAELWADQYGFADARDYLDEKLNEGSAALLLDGLDEVLGGESQEEAARAYDRATAEVGRLATRYRRALITVTCRRHGWKSGLPSFHVLEALDFEWQQIQAFVANWFGERDRRNAGLVRALSRNARLQTLAANPLLLSLIAIVYERDLELPERRAELYKRCVEVLLHEWDAHRRIKRFSSFTTDRKKDLLKLVALHYHERGQRYFREDDLLALIADFLPTIDLPASDSQAILDEIATQYGLLKAQAHGWYGFLHLTLQEHFVAVALLERGAAGIGSVLRRRYDAWWEEAILLLAGSLPDATDLLLGVLQLPPGPRRTTGPEGAETLVLPDDDLFHTDLLLAARCLSGIPRVADVGLRRQIVRSVWRLCETSAFGPEQRRAAEAIVGFANSPDRLNEIIRFISDDSRNLDARTALLHALGQHGGRGAGERLLGLFTLRPEADPEIRDGLVRALGELRVDAAVPPLIDELRSRLGTTSERGDPSALVVRALDRIGGAAEDILETLEGTARSSQEARSSYLTVVCCEALRKHRDDNAAQRVFALLAASFQDGLAIDQEHLAHAYLSMRGDSGLDKVLDLVASASAGPIEKSVVMFGVAACVEEGHGRDHQDRFLDLARNHALEWPVRWIALECLDGHPGRAEDLRPLLTDPCHEVRVAAAATLAAWGVPIGLGLVQDAILQGSLRGGLPTMAHFRSGRLPARFGRILAPYGVSDLAHRLYQQSEEAAPQSDAFRTALWWLRELDADLAVRLLLRRLGPLGSDRHPRVRVPHDVKVPRSRAVQVLDALNAAGRVDGLIAAGLLKSVADVADDVAAVERLLPLLLAESRGIPQTPVLDALHEVSRRARVRVMPDHTIVPLP